MDVLTMRNYNACLRKCDVNTDECEGLCFNSALSASSLPGYMYTVPFSQPFYVSQYPADELRDSTHPYEITCSESLSSVGRFTPCNAMEDLSTRMRLQSAK